MLFRSAYPLGINGIVVGEGNTDNEAIADLRSAINFHIESFGKNSIKPDSPVLEAFVAEAGIVI